MASFVKFYCFVEDLGLKKHNLDTDTLKVYLTNTAPSASNTVYNTPTDLSTANGYTNGGGTISAIGCSFGFRTEAGAGGGGTRYVTFGDAAIGAGSHVFTDNVYFNVGAATWSENASFNADSEWLSTIDTGQINNTTTNSFTNVDGSNLDLTTAAKAIRKQLPIRIDTGVNGLPYSWHYGSWQYGATGIMLGINLKRRTRRRSGFIL